MYDIFKFFLLFLILSSCTSLNKKNLSHTAVYPHSYSSVWRAALLVLKDYPIEIEDEETGEIKTRSIRAYEAWKPPPGLINDPKRRVYSLEVFLEKGFTSNETPLVRVTVMKTEFENKDFIQQNVAVQSNGIEENLILYRIQRELFLLEEQKKFREKKQTISPSNEGLGF